MTPHTGHSRNILSHLPSWLNRWFGYRSAPVPQRPPYIIWFWSWIGAFCGIALVQAIFGQASYFIKRGVPPIVASYGASAVLVYGVLEGPLAQPRALVGGHFIGALIGVCISKLFLLLPTEQRFQELSWLASSLACATAIVMMQITQTTHPPAGATAFLPILLVEVREMGWYFLPVILLTSTLVLTVALITNNIQRRYPVFWFTPPAPPSPPPPPVHRQHHNDKPSLPTALSSTTASVKDETVTISAV